MNTNWIESRVRYLRHEQLMHINVALLTETRKYVGPPNNVEIRTPLEQDIYTEGTLPLVRSRLCREQPIGLFVPYTI